MASERKEMPWEKVHLFISSTFNDMHAERDYLVKRVFPDLRDWCEERKLRLVDIDLRWGVTEADASNKNAVKVCLEYINRCRPFFVCLLGQRHGYAPGQEGISSETFNEFPDLRSELHPAASITELEIRHAIFRPLAWRDPKDHSRLIHYNLAEHAFFYFREPGYLEELKETLFAAMQREGDEARDASDPEKLKGAARQSFCTYTDEIGPEDETEDEREKRELSIEALQDLRRDIVEHDITQSLAHQPIKYGARWRTDLRAPELALPLECPFQDETGRRNWRKAWNRWGHLGLDSADLLIPESKQAAAQRHNETLTRGRLSKFRTVEETREQFPPGAELARVIQHDLREAILARYPDRREIPETTDLQREIDQHEEFISNSVEGFIERGDDFIELDDYVESDSNQLFVLTAAGGMGKSTLLAKWIDLYRPRIKDRADHSIHFRFIGQSEESGTVYALLRSLLREVKEVAGKLDEESNLDPLELRQKLPELLAAIGQRGPTVIIIDALDQLESGLSDLNWMPQQLPENIKLIVSFKREGEASEEVFRRFKGSDHVRLSEVEPFENEEDRRRLVRVYLSQYLKKLDEPHLETLIQLRGASNPLYLKVVLSELRVFGAFASLREKIRRDFGDTPVSAFAGVLNRLESDPAYSPIDPKQAVPLIFGLLAHARRGVSVEELTSIFIQTLELEDNIKTREAVADTIYLFLRQIRPFMARREARHDFFYESFREAVIQKYVLTPSPASKDSATWHRMLADCFSERWSRPSVHALSELPYHLAAAAQTESLVKILTSLPYLHERCTHCDVYELIADYEYIHSTEIEDYKNLLKRHASRLSRFPNLFFSLALREGFPAAKHQALRLLENSLWKKPWFRVEDLPLPAALQMAQLGGIEILTKTEFDRPRLSCIAPKAAIAFYAQALGKIGFVDLASGRMLHQLLTTERRRALAIACSENGEQLVIAYENGFADLFSLQFDTAKKLGDYAIVAKGFPYLLPAASRPFFCFAGNQLCYQRPDGMISSPDEVRMLDGANSVLQLLSSSGDHAAIVLQSGNAARLLTTGSGNRTFQAPAGSQVTSVCWLDETRIAFATDDRKTTICEVVSEFREIRSVKTKEVITGMVLAKEALLMLSHSGTLYSCGLNEDRPPIEYQSNDLNVFTPNSLVPFHPDTYFACTARGIVNFRLAEEKTAAEDDLEAIFDRNHNGYLGIVRNASGYRIFSSETENETSVSKHGGGRWPWAYDSKNDLLATVDDTHAIAVFNARTACLRKQITLPGFGLDPAIAADPSGGIWVILARTIFYLSPDGEFSKVMEVEFEIAGSAHIQCWKGIASWLILDAVCRYHSGHLTTDQLRTLIFYSIESSDKSIALKQIGSRAFPEGNLECYTYFPHEDSFVLKFTEELRTGGAEDFLNHAEKKVALRSIDSNCIQAAPSCEPRNVFLLSAWGNVFQVDIDTGRLKRVYSASRIATAIAPCAGQPSILAVLDGRYPARIHFEGITDD